MRAHGLARLGRDVEIRSVAGGESVGDLSLAFSYGRKDRDGKRQTQWVKGALWGKRAEALAPYLLKGGLVVVDLEDLRIENFEGKNGPSSSLVGTVVGVELAGGGQTQRGAEPQQPPRQTAPPPRSAAPPARSSSPSGFDDMDSDVPW